MVACPTCGHMNEPDSVFCEQDGTSLQGASAPIQQAVPTVEAALVMPDQSEVRLAQTSRVFGRSDFIRHLKPENAKEVSRGHFTITQENGVFFLQDGGADPNSPNAWKPSVNRTSINGVVLEPGGKRKLSNNDVIDVASLGLNLTFKAGK